MSVKMIFRYMAGLTTMALIGGATSLLGTGINAASNSYNNKYNAQMQQQINASNQQHAKEMLASQQNFNRESWNLQNEYNDPKAQMARLREAGLNPNLVYGNGATTQAGAVAPASGTPAQGQAPKREAFRMGEVNPMMSYFDIQQREAQTDNLRAQNTLIQTQAALESVKATTELERAKDLGYSNARNEQLSPYFSDFAKLQLQKATNDVAQSGIDVQLKQQDYMQKGETFQHVLQNKVLQNEQLKSQMSQVEIETMLKKVEHNLKKLGISPNDPTWMRVGGQLLNEYFMDFKTSLKEAHEGMQRRLKRNYDRIHGNN